MKKSDKENKVKETKKISLIYLVIIIVICIILGIFIGALTPVIDLFDNMFGKKEITEPINQYIKDKLDIKTQTVENKELVYITNNNSETVYGINLYGMFYDEKDRPIDTEVVSILFIEPGETIATLIECYDEEKNLTKFAECIVDLQLEIENEYIKNTFQPLVGNKNKIKISDVEIKGDEWVSYASYKVENNSESKCARLHTIAVFYNNGVPVYATEELTSDLVQGKTKQIDTFTNPGLEYDEVKVYLKEAYKYNYQ